MRYLLIFIFLIFNSCSAIAAHLYPEKHYQNLWCSANNGQTEYKLYDNTRVDCLTNQYAVEFDFAAKWAESIGQSLYYSSVTGKTPGIVLIVESPEDLKYYYRIKPLCERLGITLFKI